MLIQRKAVVHFLLLTAFLFVILPALSAAQSETEELRLEDLISELVKSNPALLAAEIRYKAASLKPAIERAFPDPRISFGWMSAGTLLPGGGIGEDPNANVSLQVAQMIPYPGKRDLRSSIAKKEAENAKWMQSSALKSRVAALKAAYYELAAVHQVINLLKEHQDLLLQLQKVAEARYAVGKAMQQDLIRAGTEVAILENRRLSLTQKELSLAAEIDTLLNRAPTIPLGRPQLPEMPQLAPYEKLIAVIRQNSPVLKAQQATIDGRQLEIQLAKKEKLPDVDLMSGYYYMGELEDMWEVKAEISIPVFSKSKRRAQVERAGLELAEAHQNYRSTEQMLEFRLRDAYVKAETAKNLVDLYSSRIVPQSRLALESSLASYESGGVDFFTVLANFATIVEYRINLYEQQAEYLKALTVLEELLGVEPIEMPGQPPEKKRVRS